MTDTPKTAPLIVAEIEKSARETVRVALSEYQGTPIVSVRVHYRALDGTLRPGKSGLECGLRHLPALAAALATALATARATGCLPPE